MTDDLKLQNISKYPNFAANFLKIFFITNNLFVLFHSLFLFVFKRILLCKNVIQETFIPNHTKGYAIFCKDIPSMLMMLVFISVLVYLSLKAHFISCD